MVPKNNLICVNEKGDICTHSIIITINLSLLALFVTDLGYSPHPHCCADEALPGRST